MNQYLKKEIKYLPGVGPKRASNLNKELDIYTFEDLLYYFPFKYIDRSKFYSISDIRSDMAYIQVKGRIISFYMTGGGRKKYLTANFTDGTGVIQLIWFQGIKWIQDTYKPDVEYVIFGKPNIYNRKISIPHPEIEETSKIEETPNAIMQAVYSTTEKLKTNYISSRTISKLMTSLMGAVQNQIEETLPEYLVNKYRLLSLSDALYNIHFPQSKELLKKAEFRLKFEELLLIQLKILKQRNIRNERINGHIFKEVGSFFNGFYSRNLKFELTDAQKRVMKEIRKDLGSGIQMNRLLQGDVGSGKTLVALMSMLLALDNHFQTCLMAPTEILANQHYKTITNMLDGLEVEVNLLTGSTKKSERDEIHERLRNGKMQILIGTHALLEDEVVFNNLGLVIIDEQHRFGVAQRAKLWKKNIDPPHVLVMTATPIPRTLAMTLYGDLDVSVIDELPPGRKPIATAHYFDKDRLKVFGFLRKQIELGRQVYVVYPLIKESEKMDYKDLEDGYESISRVFPPPDYAVSIVHGKMKSEEKDIAMQMFVKGKTHIMVATTVIEVGVDVPNASVMVIESAERFGLSQLHQLRGRVGRGADQSYCILMTSYKLTHEARQRINTMVGTNDGFEIAEADMKLRGPGDIEGTQQSGIAFNMKIANLARDGQLIEYARQVAQEVLNDDPLMQSAENAQLNERLKKEEYEQFNWSRIS
ncbi:MAG: ATP-dependent DNA helicase RecG [Bacteroidales bacterium]|nr:ATP-dependent DNA helicase RecG [Bacteroidales bacterium]